MLFFTNFVKAQQDGDDISIGKYKIIHSEILDEDRTLLIHLPQNYEKSGKTYPVLYMLYGNHTSTYFAETVSILDAYGSDGTIPEMILVSITNTDRYRDLLPLDRRGNKTGIDNFLQFFKAELIPFVEKNYRTKQFRALLGPQAGANFSMYAMFNEPDLFDAFFIQNPFRWTGGRDLLMQQAEINFTNNKGFKKFMFITYVNNDELDLRGNEYIEEFTALVNDNKPVDFQLELNYLPENTDFLVPLEIRAGLKSYFEEYQFPTNIIVQQLKDITDYYENLSQKYGFEIDISGILLVKEADKLSRQRRTRENVEILNYIIEKNANPENAYMRLSDISMREGDLEKVKEYLEKTLTIIGSDAGMVKSRHEQVVKTINESASFAIEQEVKNSGIEKGKIEYAEILESGAKYFNESEFNTAGYRFLQSGKIDEAIFIFEINTQKFPKSANAFDSYAEAFMTKGNNELAIINYNKVLEFDSENANAKQQIVYIGGNKKMVNTGEYSLNCISYGEGKGPSVILINGMNRNQKYWLPIIPDISSFTTVFTYDPLGMGNSDQGEYPQSGDIEIKNLKTLLEKRNIPKPYILVGHSFGGIYARLFAAAYPNDVAGLILEDATPIGLENAIANVLEGDNKVNFQKFTQMRPPAMKKTEELVDNSKLPQIPLIVLNGTDNTGMMIRYSEETRKKIFAATKILRTKMSEIIPDGKEVLVDGAGHVIHIDKPQAVIDAVKEVYNKTKD